LDVRGMLEPMLGMFTSFVGKGWDSSNSAAVL
jgi:hypothetical protein